MPEILKKEYKASYTIEASLLFPIILTVIVFIIYGAFYIHDRAVLDAAAYGAALRGSEITSEKGDIFAKVKEAGERAIEDRLLATRDVDMDIEIGKDKITVKNRGDFKIPAGVVLVPGMDFGGSAVRAEGHSARLDPTGFVRECRVVENLR